MKSKYLIPKIASWLIIFGLIISMLGFALSGFSLNRYAQHERRWYNVVSVYNE
ncbi:MULTISPECIES: hypothetical protein [Enterococcus]|uniref:Uncharacterized protein n=1 Tax=Candidatus Enterococcus ferrettii TaxID=2815324 RepID=A0ABV0ETN9_9ENTE|nr:hypothetical protein [Enterococcus sp. 665A]MBO1342459.1 hypothetical protein [Enterococcus sp. 665A]